MKKDQYITIKETFYDANEGFIKGNLSKNIYKGYKNYQEKEIKFNNDKDALLLFIQKCDLAINDLTLYLDLHEDEESLKMLNYYKQQQQIAKEKYLKEYGILTQCQITTPYKWNDNPFPWEV